MQDSQNEKKGPNGAYEINVGLIKLIERETFAGDPKDNPYKHIETFNMLCSTVRLESLTGDELKLKLFPFSLKGKAEEWLRSKPKGHFKSWEGISESFLQHYFPKKMIYNRRYDIMSFKQSNNEKLIPAYIRFLKLLHDCPSHNLPNWLLLDIFYGGLNPSSKTDLDAASHGSFSNKSLEEAWHILDIMHTNFI